jgi:hypothetical protein
MAITRHRRGPGVARAGEIAAIDHVDAALHQRLRQTGDTQRFRSHQGTPIAGTDIGRRADEGNRRQRPARAPGTHVI